MVFTLTRDPRLGGLRRTLLRLGRYQPGVRGLVSRGAHPKMARPPALHVVLYFFGVVRFQSSLDDAHPAAPPPSLATRVHSRSVAAAWRS